MESAMAEGNGQSPVEMPAPRGIITIRWEQAGHINVNFPTDQFVCDAMLAGAARAIAEAFAKAREAARPTVQVADAATLRRLRG